MENKLLHNLHIELVKLQKEIIKSGLKLLVILEGRDAAGKDGTIKVITKHLSPRETRVVALGVPSDRQEKEWFFERYSKHLPVSGEFVIFNRSWYNRAGLEKVMSFCTKKEYQVFFKDVDLFEKMLCDSGFIILKYYLDISKKEQAKRLNARKKDPLKQWKMSPIDEVAIKHWKDYSKARNKMLMETNFAHAPWYVVNANNKEQTHKEIIIHILKNLDYRNKKEKLLKQNDKVLYPATADNINNRLFP